MQDIKRKLFDDLNKVCESLDRRFDVNSGGCCYVAYCIAYYLDKFGIKYSLKCCDDDVKRNNKAIINEIRSMDRNTTDETSICGIHTVEHYYIHINHYGDVNLTDEYWDCEEYTIPSINYTHIKWIYDNGDWNPHYDVHDNKKVKRAIYNIFKKYGKEIKRG